MMISPGRNFNTCTGKNFHDKSSISRIGAERSGAFLSNATYEYGSAARKLKYDNVKENPVKEKKQKKVKYTKVKLRIFFLMLLIFGCGMTIMYRYALITDLNYKIDESKREYNKLKNSNLTDRVKIENSLDLEKVRDAAEGKYGMHKPQREQFVSVNVPKADYIKTNESAIVNDVTNRNIIVAGFLKIARTVGLIK